MVSYRGGSRAVLLSSSLPADKMNDNSCSHQASHLVKPIILDFTEIKATNNQRLIDIKGFTEPKHEQWISSPAGSEHYILLHHLATKYYSNEQQQPRSFSSTNCPRRQHLVDIGTRYVTSALAMASAPSSPMHAPKVLTFDIPTSNERQDVHFVVKQKKSGKVP